MDLSFTYSTDALLAGRLHCTRRWWRTCYLVKWQRAYDRGEVLHAAYDHLPCVNGRQIGTLRLTHRPERVRIADLPETDFCDDGGPWPTKASFLAKYGPDRTPVVIRFEFINPVEPETAADAAGQPA